MNQNLIIEGPCTSSNRSLNNWHGCCRLIHIPLPGRYCLLAPLDVGQHAKELFQAFQLDSNGLSWTYLPYGPFFQYEQFYEWLCTLANNKDLMLYTVIDRKQGIAIGMVSYLNIRPEHGVIEVGHVHYSPLLQRKIAATEAMFLMMQYVFDDGYLRYEWKCNNLNLASRRSAQRLGFKFEGIFRQHMVCKNTKRDTAWFSILDTEWPMLKLKFETWLSPDNFDKNEQQLRRLEDI